MPDFEEILREYIARETARRERLELAAKVCCASDKQARWLIAEWGNPFRDIEQTELAHAVLRGSCTGELHPLQKWDAICALYNVSAQLDWGNIYGRWLAEFSRVIEAGLTPAIIEALSALAPVKMTSEPESITGTAERFKAAAARMLELVKVATRRMVNSQARQIDKPETGEPAQPKTSLLGEGEWLMPPVALADLANRLGNVGPAKAKTILRRYGLRIEGNRQSWTCRLDAMPPDLRRRVEGKR